VLVFNFFFYQYNNLKNYFR